LETFFPASPQRGTEESEPNKKRTHAPINLNVCLHKMNIN